MHDKLNIESFLVQVSVENLSVKSLSVDSVYSRTSKIERYDPIVLRSKLKILLRKHYL